MTDNYRLRRAKRRDVYEAPQAIYLTDPDRAYGACGTGSTPAGYHENNFQGGPCVTGKSASGGCYAGVTSCQTGSTPV